MDDKNGIILLDEIIEERRTITVKVEANGQEKEVQVTYNPSKFTPEMEAAINADKGESLGDSFMLLLEPLFIDWSVKLPPAEAGGEPRDFPPTRENLSKVPFPVLSQFIRAIMEDIVPKKANTKR